MPNQYTALPVDQRFWSRVVAGPNECLLWVGAINSEGYGSFQVSGRTGGAHRWAWTMFEGPIPDGMTLDHLCCVPLCMNTDHMEVVTNQENAGRAIRRRNAWARMFEWFMNEPTYKNSVQFFQRG